jgi:hypothetical protein
MDGGRSDALIGAGRSADPAQDLLAAQLGRIHEQNKLPLLSTDMDDTLLPFGSVISEGELDLLMAYVDAGGQLVVNTLAPKEWFYLRVIDRLVNTVHQKRSAHLLYRVHWIVSGGREIFVYDSPQHSYRRIYAAGTGSKAEGLMYLLRHLGDRVAILAFYGDRFDDPEHDGNALGAPDIPLVVNVGADQQLPQSNTAQRFVNVVEKGPATTLRHLAFITTRLRELSPRVLPVGELVLPRECTPSQRPWRFEGRTDGERWREVEVQGPGFVWSWNDQGLCYLTALVRVVDHPICKAAYRAGLPDGIVGFTFFWTGGPDAASGHSAGHWEGRDFRIGRDAVL